MISNTHIVEVRDFDFLPLDITVEAGDTILFDWTGDIPHTVTSDATNGNSTFNSGLLENGDQWILVLEEVGEHPYYCIPHGGPDGIGMAGNITVVDPCDDGEVLAEFSFITNKTSGSYSVMLNGVVTISDMEYTGEPQNGFTLILPADNSMLTIEVVDNNDTECMSELSIDGINCDDPCFEVNADFEYDINFATMEVAFNDISTGEVVSWSWDFGDGASSSEQNPKHTYADPLVYNVCLTVIDIQNCESTFCDKVRFSDEVCIAGFTYEQDDLGFTFTNTSDYEDPNTEILWTFGDGAISNNIDTVSHIYELGLYTVCIQIASDSCVVHYCEDLDLSNPCLGISPEFELVKDGESLTVQFNDLSTGQPDSWLWGFGDGATSTEQNPQHEYTSMGTYNVCLFVQESANNCSKSICKNITVGTTSVVEVEHLKPLNLYPNPTARGSKITISGFERNDINKEARLKLYSVDGAELENRIEILNKEMALRTDLSSGSYFIQIQTEENVYQSMFIIL